MASMTRLPRFGTCARLVRAPYAVLLTIERTAVDVRIGVTQAPREINIEVADDTDRVELRTRVDAAAPP